MFLAISVFPSVCVLPVNEHFCVSQHLPEVLLLISNTFPCIASVESLSLRMLVCLKKLMQLCVFVFHAAFPEEDTF